MWRCICKVRGKSSKATSAQESAGLTRSRRKGPGTMVWRKGRKIVKYQEARNGAASWVCQICGHYGQSRLKGLIKKCEGRCSKQLATPKWFAKGLHPKTKKPITKAERLGRQMPSKATVESPGVGGTKAEAEGISLADPLHQELLKLAGRSLRK